MLRLCHSLSLRLRLRLRLCLRQLRKLQWGKVVAFLVSIFNFKQTSVLSCCFCCCCCYCISSFLSFCWGKYSATYTCSEIICMRCKYLYLMHTHSQVIMAKMATRKQQRPSLKVTVSRRTTPRLNVLSLSLTSSKLSARSHRLPLIKALRRSAALC